MLKFLLDILRGVVVGVANIIPGVSGGTMMASMGIYDTIIECINNLFKDFKKSVMTLLPFAIGMLAGILGFAVAIKAAFAHFPIPTALLFIGLIFGGIPMIFKKVVGKKAASEKEVKKPDAVSIVLFLLFFAFIIALEIIGQRTGVERSLSLSFSGIIISFIVGIIGAATMIIPGVSGSMIMLILGYYNSIIDTINELLHGLKGGDFSAVFHNLLTLIPFVIGVLIGIFGVAKLIRFLLNRYEAKTYSAILGLIVASPYPVYVHAGVESISVIPVLIGVVTFAIGFMAAFKLGTKE